MQSRGQATVQDVENAINLIAAWDESADIKSDLLKMAIAMKLLGKQKSWSEMFPLIVRDEAQANLARKMLGEENCKIFVSGKKNHV